MVSWLLVLAIGGGQVDVRVVSSHKSLDACKRRGGYEMDQSFSRGLPAHYACIETRR